MSNYPTISDIEIAWRSSGSGICVIVEGDTELEDPWFYHFWFGSRARELTFFPQDGWTNVVAAVRELRARLSPKCIYGILDRDFEELPLVPPIPVDGILRTPKYTLENYLLDPICWYNYLRPHMLRHPHAGWRSAAEAQATIEGTYRECLPLSAFNWTLRYARSLDRGAFAALPETNRTYREHPRAIELMASVPDHLRSIQAEMGVSEDLAQKYQDRLNELQAMTLAEWEEVVSGKYVLKLLRERFPLRLSGNQAWDDVLSAYIDGCPEPHLDLVNLVDLILQDAHA